MLLLLCKLTLPENMIPTKKLHFPKAGTAETPFSI
jgi:hypothetical protein